MPTITVHPSAILESESSFQSIDSSYPFSNAIGKGTDSNTYAQWYMVTGGAAFTTVYYAFDLSEIPENATITSVTCEAKCQCQNSSAFRGGNNALALYSGDTKMSATATSSAAFGTTATVVEIPETTWTREQLNNCKILIQATRGFLSTSTSYYIRFYGADLTVTYEIPVYHTVSVTQSTGGTISLSQSGQVLEGTTISVNAAPEDGYELENVYVNGNVLAETSFIVDEDKTVTAVFNPLIRYTISTSITGGVLRSPTEASISLNSGEDYEITFKGNDESTFSSMTINGENVTPIVKNDPVPLPTYTVSTNYSTYQTYYLSNAYDGDDSTYFWSSEAQANGKYILITFSDFINLNSFSTYSSSSTDYPQSCNTLQVSVDRSTWTNIGTFSDSQTSTFSNITNANNIKYVRIYADNSNVDKWLVLNEITMNYEAAGLGEEYYSYTISSIDRDKNVVIIFNEPSAYYVKINRLWRKVLAAYRKVSGVWEEFDYIYDDSFQLRYLGHITSDIIGEVTSDYNIIITDTSVPNDTYYFYYENENKEKLADWDVIGSTEFNEYNGGTTTVGEEVGTIASDNTISLTSASLPSGDYTMYYEDADGTKLEGWGSIGIITK